MAKGEKANMTVQQYESILFRLRALEANSRNAASSDQPNSATSKGCEMDETNEKQVDGDGIACSVACQRRACEKPLSDECCRIWNDPTTSLGYRDYCTSCGWRIIQANRESLGKLGGKLRYEVLRPFSDVSMGARFHYPGCERIWVKVGHENYGLIVEYSEKHMQFGAWGGQQCCSAKEKIEEACPVWTVA